MGNQNSRVNFQDEVNLNHFRLLRVVGKGAFGKVRIVERKDTGLTFALKYIRKDEVVRSESVRNIIRERRMMEHLNHPFICNLRYSFQDIEYMYIVLDLMNGGDLRFHISRKTFTEEAVQFWIAELGCALRYIHKQRIIHRDVKPDNVLLDSEGHVHLADFNVASDYTPGKPLTSKSGTLAYLAPEVYSGKGYGPEADWWSLGVLFYECIYNKRPFEGSTQTKLAATISAASPKYPVTAPPVSMPCLHAISSALEPDPKLRMGATWQSFTDNPFFRPLDFVALERKEIEPVFVPSSEKTNFDATYDLEELLLEEAPLEARARRQKPRETLKDDATDKEIREEELYKMIENGFEPFDYTALAYEQYAGATDTVGLTKSNTELAQAQIAQAEGRGRNGSPETTRHHVDNASGPANGIGQATVMPPPGAKVSSGNHHRKEGPVNFPSNHAKTDGRHSEKATSSSNNSKNSKTSSPVTTPLAPYQPSYSRTQRPSGTRNQSVGGGMQVVLGEQGSWTQLARQDASLPADAKLLDRTMSGDPPSTSSKSGGGMLGFLKGKKGRGSSPRPGKVMERGILGKEGARVVISG